MSILSTHAQTIRGFLAGFLFLLGISIFKEAVTTGWLFILALALIALAVWLARTALRHAHGNHRHLEETAIHVVTPGLLLLVNILHPAVDGFSLYETFERGGVAIGILALVGVVLHEIVRQWALIIAFAKMNIRRSWVVIATALLGIGIGVGFGYFGTHILHDHEGTIDLITLFAYSFIIAEFWYADHDDESGKNKWLPVAIGIIIAALFSIFFQAH